MVGRGVLVVKLWWIAGESWEVDGQDSGSKNMPLFRIYFWGIPILGMLYRGAVAKLAVSAEKIPFFLMSESL